MTGLQDDKGGESCAPPSPCVFFVEQTLPTTPRKRNLAVWNNHPARSEGKETTLPITHLQPGTRELPTEVKISVLPSEALADSTALNSPMWIPFAKNTKEVARGTDPARGSSESNAGEVPLLRPPTGNGCTAHMPNLDMKSTSPRSTTSSHKIWLRFLRAEKRVYSQVLRQAYTAVFFLVCFSASLRQLTSSKPLDSPAAACLEYVATVLLLIATAILLRIILPALRRRLPYRPTATASFISSRGASYTESASPYHTALETGEEEFSDEHSVASPDSDLGKSPDAEENLGQNPPRTPRYDSPATPVEQQAVTRTYSGSRSGIGKQGGAQRGLVTSKSCCSAQLVRPVCNTTECSVRCYSNGDRYEGEMIDGKFNGKGVYTFNESGVYEGDWEDGKYDGYGVESWIQGSKYRGQYRHGLREGYGIYRFHTGVVYSGQWLKGQSHGVGVQVCCDGSRYMGEFSWGSKHGAGKYLFCNGDSYKGEYFSDRMHGYGVYNFANGHRYEGAWHEGRKQGLGVYSFTCGEEWAGYWHLGVLVTRVGPCTPSASPSSRSQGNDGLSPSRRLQDSFCRPDQSSSATSPWSSFAPAGEVNSTSSLCSSSSVGSFLVMTPEISRRVMGDVSLSKALHAVQEAQRSAARADAVLQVNDLVTKAAAAADRAAVAAQAVAARAIHNKLLKSRSRKEMGSVSSDEGS